MKLSIVIPNFNTRKLLKECLDSIKKNRGELSLEVIVVDNGSTDSSVDYLKKISRDKMIQIILLNQNWGFAGAVNRGIEKATGEFVFLLNSDTVVPKDALREVVEFAKRHPQSIVDLQLVNPDGSVQPSVYHFPSISGAIKEFWLGQKDSYQKYFPKSKRPVKIDAVTGAAMLIPKKIIKKVGLFDEKYFFYFEDLDYCRRAKRMGFDIYYLPSVKIIHHHGAAAEGMPEITHQWLVESSKKYNGLIKYYLLTLVIWSGQKWQKFFKKKELAT